MGKLKRCVVFIFLCILTLSLTGCDNKLVSPGQAIVEVGERNKKIIFSLRDMGALSPSQSESYAELINDNINKYKEIIEGSDDSHLNELKSAIVNVLGNDAEHGLYGVTNEGTCPVDGENFMTVASEPEFEVDADALQKWTSNFAQVEGGRGGEVKAYYESAGGASKTISPLVFIDKNNLSSLVKDINKEVYVLNPQALQTENDFNTLMGLLQKLKERKEQGELKYTDFSQILPYFKRSNETIFNFTEEDIITETKSYTEGLGKEMPSNSTINKDVVVSGIVEGKVHKLYYKGEEKVCKTESSAKAVGVYTLRVQEFNAEILTELQEGAYTSDKYLSVAPQNKNEVGVALLMEYPVDVLEKLVTDRKSNKWYFETKETDVLVNIYNAEMLYKQENGEYKVINNEEKEEDRIYRVAGANAKKQTDKGKNTSFKLVSGENIRFLLTDYLELTYMPKVVNEEDFIATGRRISITDIKGEGDQIIGFFANKLGDKVEGNSEIRVSDIIDYTSGEEPYYKYTAKVLDAVYTNPIIIQEELEKTEEERVEYLYRLLAPISSGEENGMVGDKLLLNYKVGISEINPILQFTSEKEKISLDKVDIDNDSVKGNVFYGLCVNTHAYNSGLYTTWIDINGDGGDNGSLMWWNAWLGNHGYIYHINVYNLKSTMLGVYKSSLSDVEQRIDFDVETLRVINETMKEQERTYNIKLIRTLEALIGGFLLMYGLILMGLWVIDVNMVNGPNLLGLATFGKFVAVSDNSEIPLMPGDGKIYVDFKALFIATMIFMVVGILLLLFDIQVFWNMIPKMFKSLTDALVDLLLNK